MVPLIRKITMNLEYLNRVPCVVPLEPSPVSPRAHLEVVLNPDLVPNVAVKTIPLSMNPQDRNSTKPNLKSTSQTRKPSTSKRRSLRSSRRKTSRSS